MAQSASIPLQARLRTAAAATLSTVAPQLASRWLETLFLSPRQYPTPLREQHWLAAAQCQRIRFNAAISLPVYRWAAPQPNAPKVLLVHGISGRGSQLGAFVQPLRDAGYEVISYDAPAHGDADGRQASLPQFAQALEIVARHLGPLEACIAHSIGAAATAIALSRGIRCKRVVLVAPPENPADYLARLSAWVGFRPFITQQTQRRLESRFGLLFEHARGSHLAPDLSTPALILHDQQDRVVAIHQGRALHQAWPESHMIESQGLGHNRILRDPTMVATAVEFISGAKALRSGGLDMAA